MNINKQQLNEIRNYLSSKKLQTDLLIEIQDHFISQIIQLMNSKNIGFEEAFLQTKILWMGELRMVKASIISFKKITVIEKKIINKRLNKIMLNTILLIPIVFGINFLLPNSAIIIQFLLICIIFFLVGLSLYKKKLKFREYLFIGFHPLLLKILLVGFLLRFLIIPISLNLMNPNFIEEFLKNNVLIIAFLGITQIQLLYFNYKNKKVLL